MSEPQIRWHRSGTGAGEDGHLGEVRLFTLRPYRGQWSLKCLLPPLPLTATSVPGPSPGILKGTAEIWLTAWLQDTGLRHDL